jgi:protein-S-isoprenylcysteine O-methyltransferase Ste14
MKVETFSFDVAELAMHTIAQFETKKSKLENWIFWGIAIVLIVITTLLCLPFLPKVLAIFSSNSVWTTLFASATGILLFTVLLIDVIKQHKSKEQKLLNQQVQPIR